MISALTIDVEDGINIAMRDHFNIQISPTERVVSNVENLLDLLDTKGVKATFFILGQVVEYYPHLAKKIYSLGHEIGVHGYDHLQFFRMTKSKAREDLYRSKALIEDTIGVAVHGYRAPAFSVTPETSWAFEIISELGFKYDSSVMPKGKGRYGWPGFNPEIQEIIFPDGKSLIEVPLSVVNLIGKKIPACGGGYLRLFPYSFTRWSFRRIASLRPVVVYLHPYEIDTIRYPDYYFKEVNRSKILKKMALYSYRINKGTVLNKLDTLLSEFSFDTMQNVINSKSKSLLKIRVQDLH